LPVLYHHLSTPINSKAFNLAYLTSYAVIYVAAIRPARSWDYVSSNIFKKTVKCLPSLCAVQCRAFGH